MRKSVCVVVILLAFLVLWGGSVYAEEVNLLKNPGFEEGENDFFFWDKKVWDTAEGASEVILVKGQGHDGGNCVKITNNKPNDARLAQTVTVKPGSIYKVSGWIKTENVGADKGANLSVWGLFISSEELKGTNDWTHVEMYGKTGPDQQTLEFTAGVGGHGSLNTGTAYFDEISFEEATTIPDNATILNFYDAQKSSGQTQQAAPQDKSNWPVWIIGLLVLVIAASAFFVFKKSGSMEKTAVADSGAEASEENKEGSEKGKTGRKPFKVDKKDLLIMSAMTLIYLAIALYNLGGTKMPQTYWKPLQQGESFTVTLDKQYDIGRIAYYNGIGDLKIKVDYQADGGKFLPIATMDQVWDKNLRWMSADINKKTVALKFTVTKVGGTCNEIAIFERGSETPIKGYTITEKDMSAGDEGKSKLLFDEQNLGDYRYNYMNSAYFDEIYHPRTAFENLHRMDPSETTHPPLGKLIMAIGVFLFGMNPFGWRIMGTLFGAAMIPILYLLGKKIFSKRLYGFIAAFLVMFDTMHFAQTRIGTIDSYPTVFLLLAYFFMFDSFMYKSYEVGFKKSLKPLLLAGIFWGLAAASKWTGLYTGGGLAVLFLTAKFLEYREYKKAVGMGRKKGKLPQWTTKFMKENIIYTGLCCVVFFVIIPGIIYVSSYLPIITLPGPQHNIGEVLKYQKDMLDYHSKLTSTHPFQSPAYSWPLDSKPLLEYRAENLPADKVSIMYVFGNPAIFWFGIFCIAGTAFIGAVRRDKKAFLLLVGLAFQYGPWFLISRCVFIYHFFTAVPFLMLCIVYILNYLREELPAINAKASMSKKAKEDTYRASTAFIYGYLVLVAAMFILFYPAASGMVVDISYLQYVKWLHIL